MLSLPPSVRIFLARGPTDMRKQIDGLAGLVEHVLQRDPFSGHLFVFCNRARDRIKILYWESSGYWLMHKRLEAGRFAWPDSESTSFEMTATELHALLGGLDISKAVQRRRFRKKSSNQTDPSHGVFRRTSRGGRGASDDVWRRDRGATRGGPATPPRARQAPR
jgi:transposase